MTDSKNIRQSNIELLRIIAIIGVIVLHFNNPSLGGGFKLVEPNSVRLYVLYVLESCFIIAVDVFMIISGYFLITSNKRNLWKPIELIFQLLFFSALRYIVNSYMTGNIEASGILRSIVPNNFFIMLYITVILLSPYINILINNLNDQNRRRFMLTLFIAFSIYSTAIDLIAELTKHRFVGLSSIGLDGSQYGYTIVNFVLCYIIGAYIYLYKDRTFKIKTHKLLFFFIVNIGILTVWSVLNDYTGFFSTKSALEYCNPIIILNAIIVFLLFNKINLKSKAINELATASLTVFLCHNLFVRVEVTKVFVQLTPALMAICILAYATFLYALLYIAHKAYLVLKNVIFKRLENKFDLKIEF